MLVRIYMHMHTRMVAVKTLSILLAGRINGDDVSVCQEYC